MITYQASPRPAAVPVSPASPGEPEPPLVQAAAALVLAEQFHHRHIRAERAARDLGHPADDRHLVAAHRRSPVVTA